MREVFLCRIAFHRIRIATNENLMFEKQKDEILQIIRGKLNDISPEPFEDIVLHQMQIFSFNFSIRENKYMVSEYMNIKRSSYCGSSSDKKYLKHISVSDNIYASIFSSIFPFQFESIRFFGMPGRTTI